MAYSEPVWVEIRQSRPIRILKSFASAQVIFDDPIGSSFQMMPRSEAIRVIRHEIFLRQMAACIKCGKVFTENQMHLHERKFRSHGGEISLDNSEGLCFNCHLGRNGEHKQPKFTRRKK